MAKWKDKLRPASFRGIKFFVDTSTYDSGRRGPDHEFPDREEPYAGDSGRKQRKYDIEGYLLGSDYLAAKTQLITAAEQAGPGELVHPYFGRVRVVCRGVGVSERGGEGGFVKFTFKFVEAGQLLFPKAGSDSGFQVASAAGGLNAAAQANLESKFSVAGKPQFVIDSAADKVTAFADAIQDKTSTVSGTAAGLADLGLSIRTLKANVKDIISKPAELGAQISNAFSLLSGAMSPSDVFASAKSAFTFGSTDAAISRTTSTREQEAANLAALNEFIQTIAVTTASQAATDMDYTSVDDATQVRDQLGDQLDKLMEITGSDDVYSSAQALRAQVVKAIPPSDQTLAQISEFTPPTTVPSLVLAYQLYGSVNDEQDLIDRNKIRNPAFIMGGETLEVLDRE